MLRFLGLPAGRVLLLPVFGFLLPIPLRAQELLYTPPKDYLEDVWKVFTLVTALLAISLTGWVLVARRRKLEAFQSRAAFFLGICVLTIPVMFMSTAVGLEQAIAVDFCSSCHVMEVFVDDMMDPASTGLAAVHYQNRFIQ